MGRDPDRAHAWATTAVRDTKGLVQVQVADIRTHIAWTAKADLSIEVGAIHINLASRSVHNLSNLADGFLEHAMGGRIRHHQR